MEKPKTLIAGVGNELRQDDAFGIAFVREWERTVSSDDRITTMEVGIGGIHLVQELHSEYDILVLADAVDWEGTPGQVYFHRVESISDIEDMPLDEKRAFLADMHYTNPMRALMLAKALKVLPPEVYILGCKSVRHDDFAIGMSPQVSEAIPKAIQKLNNWLTSI